MLEDKSVGFFSIDTDVIHSHAYKFSAGALRTLPLQRPAWLTIQQTEIVEREIHIHRMELVSKVAKELNTAIAKLQRLSRLNFTSVSEQIKALDSESAAARNCSREFKAFVASLDQDLVTLSLNRYRFSRHPRTSQ